MPAGLVPERLVADLEVEVVVGVHLADDLAGVAHLALEDGRISHRVPVLPGDVADPVHVVADVEGVQVPDGVGVGVAEEGQLDHDIVAGGLGQEAVQAGKVLLVPAVEVELSEAVHGETRPRAGERRDILARPRLARRVRVERDPLQLAEEQEAPAEGRGLVGRLGQVAAIVEVAVDHRAVVLGGGDQHAGRPR